MHTFLIASVVIWVAIAPILLKLAAGKQQRS